MMRVELTRADIVQSEHWLSGAWNRIGSSLYGILKAKGFQPDAPFRYWQDDCSDVMVFEQ